MTYLSVTNESLGAGWDLIQVVDKREDSQGVMRIANSFVIARDASGKIIRKTDIILDRWEVVEDADELRRSQYCFDERDRQYARYEMQSEQLASHRLNNRPLLTKKKNK